MADTYEFQAEITQLMSLIVNAFYSQKEIFLRELVSNSSDALDKIRYRSLTDQSVLEGEEELRVRVVPNKEANTLTVEDTGVGMTKDELVNNLGTVARSGTKRFMSDLQEGKADLSLIGQFGVGFYSAFLVADTVEVYSKSPDSDKSYKWTSNAGNQFTVEEVDDFDLKRGTRIVLHLKKEQDEYLDDNRLKDVLTKHSMYVSYPIELYMTKTKEVEVEQSETIEEADEEAETAETNEDGDTDKDKVEVEDVDDDEKDSDDEAEVQKETVEYHEFEQVNDQKPIWTKDSKEVTQEEYETFYKGLTNDYDSFAAVKHFKVEGGLEFTSLIFAPKKAPFDMFQGQKKETDVKLYVRRVFITDKCTDLVPEYLSFLRGVVDSNDLPLNVSREMLQESRLIGQMKKHITKKALEMLTDLADSNEEEYEKFYQEYSKNLKLGVHEDDKNKDKLSHLLRFYTSKHKDKPVSLKQYVEEMKDDQKGIYYLTGESLETLDNTPFLEKLRKKGYDCLLLVDAIDEYAVQKLDKYEDKELVCVTKESFKLDEEEEVKDEDYKKLLDYCKESLGEQVSKVTMSNTLESSPAVLKTGQYGWSANMQRIMKAQALNSNPMMQFMMSQKTMELNPNHKLVKMLNTRVEGGKTDNTTKNLVQLIFDTSLLTSGFTVEKPHDYASRVYRMLEVGFSLDDDDEDEDDLVEPENLPELEKASGEESTSEQVAKEVVEGVVEDVVSGDDDEEGTVMEQVD